MKALANFIMTGRGQAVMVASVSAMLALLITPLALVSAAVPALVTLRRGWGQGVQVMLLSMGALFVLGYLVFNQAAALAGIGLMLWLPAILVAEVLRLTRSLRFAIEAAVLLGVLLIAAQYLLVEDPAGYWKGLLNEYSTQFMDPQMFQDADRKILVEEMALWMPGGVGAAWFLQLALSLFLARSWQAALYNPGGFALEMQELRLGWWLLILLPLVLLLGTLNSGNPDFLAQISLVGMSAFFLQGVALVHGLVAVFKAGSGWLIGFYVMLIIGIPYSFTLISAMGFTDGWLNFRAKARSSRSSDE